MSLNDRNVVRPFPTRHRVRFRNISLKNTSLADPHNGLEAV